MERDLTDLMHANVQAREESIADLAPSSGALAGTVRRVRRRRAVRHSVQGVGAGAAVAVLAGASWFGLRGEDPAPPAVTPSPTVSTPAPTPTPTQSAAPTSAPVVLEDILGLPPTAALPPGLLEQTTPGWVLSTYRSTAVSAPNDVVAHTVVLSSPSGELYRVVDLPLDIEVALLGWEAGTTTALVRTENTLTSDDFPRAILDLTTGAITADERGLAGYPWLVGSISAGAELWWDVADGGGAGELFTIRGDGAAELVGEAAEEVAVDPTGRWAVTLLDVDTTTGPSFALLDLSTGDRSVRDVGANGQPCQVVGWLDDQAVLMWCWDGSAGDAWMADARPSLWRWDVTADRSAVHLRDLAAGDPYPYAWSGEWVSDGVLTFGAGNVDVFDCWSGAYTWDGTTFTLVQGPGASGDDQFFTRSQDGDVYVEARGGCSGEHAPSTVTAHRAGSSIVVAPRPSTTAAVPAWVEGVYSWVVGSAG